VGENTPAAVLTALEAALAKKPAGFGNLTIKICLAIGCRSGRTAATFQRGSSRFPVHFIASPRGYL